MSCLFAESLRAVVSDAAMQEVPGAIERIKAAFDRSGLDVNVTVLPNERALQSAASGEYALALYRQPKAVLGFSELIRLQPPVQSLELSLITHIDNSSYCDLKIGDYQELTVVGVFGVSFFNTDIYPLFGMKVAAPSGESALKMVAVKRIDVTFWPSLDSLSENYKKQLRLCPDHQFKMQFSSYIHKDYLWAKEAIEAAYRIEFGEP